MSKKFFITEQDRRHILSLYGLIKEDIDPVTGGEQSFKVNFKAGWYDPSNEEAYIEGQRKLTDEIDTFVKTQLIPYLKKVPSSIVGMTFRSGESKIPNTDNEGKDKGKKQPLDPGRLSELRKYYLEEYLKKVIIPQIKAVDAQAQIPEMTYIQVEAKEPWIGKPWCPANKLKPQDKEIGRDCLLAWRNAGSPDIDKYNTDQVSEFSISVRPILTTSTGTNVTEDCAVGLKIKVSVKSHICQNAEFFVLANNTLLYNTQGGMTANLNNADAKRGVPGHDSKPEYSKKVLNPGYGLLPNGDGTMGNYKYRNENNNGDIKGSRSDTFIVTPEQSKKIVNEGNGYINIWWIATTTQAHRDIPEVVITKTVNGVETVVYEGEPKVNEGKILTLDACGNKKVDIDNGQQAPPTQSALNALLAQKQKILKGNVSNDELSAEKTDSKAAILSRSGELSTESISLTNQLLKFKGVTGKTEAQSIITNYYTVFYNKIMGDQSKGEPTFERKENGKKYKDKTIDISDMYGDVRLDLDLFYAVFDAIYKEENGKINPTGRKNDKERLDLGSIQNSLRNVKKTKFAQS